MCKTSLQLPGSWISAIYLFKTKFKALNTSLNSARYTIIRERVFLFPYIKIVLGGLIVIITSQVEVNAPAERAEKLLLFLPCPYLLFAPNTPIPPYKVSDLGTCQKSKILMV
jgi:hypothetical protein